MRRCERRKFRRGVRMARGGDHAPPALRVLPDEFEPQPAIRTGDEYGRHTPGATERQRQNVRDNVAYT